MWITFILVHLIIYHNIPFFEFSNSLSPIRRLPVYFFLFNFLCMKSFLSSLKTQSRLKHLVKPVDLCSVCDTRGSNRGFVVLATLVCNAEMNMKKNFTGRSMQSTASPSRQDGLFISRQLHAKFKIDEDFLDNNNNKWKTVWKLPEPFNEVISFWVLLFILSEMFLISPQAMAIMPLRRNVGGVVKVKENEKTLGRRKDNRETGFNNT